MESGFSKMSRHIKRMKSGDTISVSELFNLGMTGEYRPKSVEVRYQSEAAMAGAEFILQGYAHDWKGADPAHSILINHQDGTFTRK